MIHSRRKNFQVDEDAVTLNQLPVKVLSDTTKKKKKDTEKNRKKKSIIK